MKNEKAITLIALVITIIVLLILAGVTIAMLTGENGILGQANQAKTQTEVAEAKERAQTDIIAWQAEQLKDGKDATLSDSIIKGILNGKDYVKEAKDTSFISAKGDHEISYKDLYGSNGQTGGETNLPSTSETTPYFPDDKSTIIDNSNLNTGLVVKDKNANEWVWVEVPKSIAANKATDTEIETALQTYAADYRESGYTDTWYEGCGLTEIEYNSNKNKMLRSIQTNGGFWIGRYEVGTETIRKAAADTLTTPVIKQDQYPYNYVTCSQAQELSNQLNPNNMKYTSSLMYGIQWDLILKYIEIKNAKTQAELKTDSTSWGNYRNATFDLVRGKYSINDGQTYTDITTYTKPNNSRVLLTTGASERNKILNIYDLAGNEWEWTLEKSTDASIPCCALGGSYFKGGSTHPCGVPCPRQYIPQHLRCYLPIHFVLVGLCSVKTKIRMNKNERS